MSGRRADGSGQPFDIDDPANDLALFEVRVSVSYDAINVTPLLGGGGSGLTATITFRNGYEADSPVMEVEYLGCSITRVNIPGTIAGEVYALKLGRIIRTERCDHLKPIAQLSLYQ